MTTVSFPLYSGAPRKTVRENFGRHEEGNMDNESDTVGGYAVPVDPMDLLQCESCQ
jgi:hypothetical protein